MNKQLEKLGLCLITTLAFTASGCDKVGPLILQSNSHTEKAYSKLAKEWLRWTMAQPHSTGPILDETGASCANDQQGKVWFLAGTFGGAVERDCTIPEHKALYFPLINRWIIPNAESADEPEEIEGYLEWIPDYFADYRAHTCELTLRLDGEDILPDLETLDAELYVEVLEPFDLYLNDDNWASQWGKPGGHLPAAWVDGHWALLEPLSPGDHVLEFGGVICDEDTIYFETSATYYLHVEGDDDDDDDDDDGDDD